MNEITKVHLGRQAFTISLDAHHKLKSYLNAITKQVEDKEIVNEIELRMAELLTERGIDNNKVVLAEDVDFLIKQLGSPDEFRENDSESDLAAPEPATGKRLFRDPDNAMIAGVAAGLSKYFGLDVLLVRLLFVFLVFVTFGWGVLLYILLWLLVPEVRTSSDRLQMAGKPVTVEGLKEVVSNADVKGTAQRIHKNLAEPVNTVFSLFLKVVGLAFVLLGLTALFGLIAGETYFLANSGAWLRDNIFPVGFREQLVLHIAVATVTLVSLFTMLLGIAIFRRKWPIRTWITGVLIGLLFIGLAAGGALAANIYPNVRDRYNVNTHTVLRSIAPFNSVSADAIGTDSINFQQSNKYYVALNYFGHPNLSTIKTTANKGNLLIDTSQFDWQRNCNTLCFPRSYNLSITIYAPNALQLENQDLMAPPIPSMPKPFPQP
ncbi:MAG TPA: PspC domain-containing protein [Candidatus Saccharimonadales bacterium]|jgi:phage shock protein PspC (stress-responsive transcriptional regulator)|nr:PspC domain-containing protein [Candidatus Saccharimonadales bacterium]